jgi:hypothetical protein
MAANVGAAWRFAVKNAPRVFAALGALDVFLKKNPAVSTWLRKQLDEIPKRLAAVQKRRGDAARIRGMLDIVRTVAQELDAQTSGRSTADAATWIRRADDIELRVRLAEAQPRPDQKKTLAGLKAEAEALLADLIEEARVRSLPATAPDEAEAEAEGDVRPDGA